MALTGCAATGSRIPLDPAAARTVEISSAGGDIMGLAEGADQDMLESKLLEYLSFCQQKLSGFEAKSERQAKNAYWLSISGLVAGAVAVPALAAASPTANAAWISGLGGWAGASTFAGQALGASGLSGTTIAKTRNDIINTVAVQIEIASDGQKSFAERRNALMKLRAACVVYEIAVPTIPDRK